VPARDANRRLHDGNELFRTGHLAETRLVYRDVEQIRVEEKQMKNSRKNLSFLMNASGPGLALSILFLVILMFAAAITEMPAARHAGDSTSMSAIVSTATAAVPATEMLAATAPVVVGADSGLDEFRLAPDSCCISHY
jgi:hypothetical protein